MYVITGATGHTGSVIAKKLLAQGKKVRVVGRNAARKRRTSGFIPIWRTPITAHTRIVTEATGKTGPIAGLHRMEERLKRRSDFGN
jgi:uncharacterized protein YbjT (DUF2867 family)